MKTSSFLKTTILGICLLSILNNCSFSQTFKTRQEAQSHANIFSSVQNTSGNYRVDQLNNIEQSIINVLFGGCVEIYNLTYTGPQLSIGYFVDESGTLGVDSGIVMTTGAISSHPFIQSPVTNFASTDNGIPGDALLDLQIPGYTTNDASIIEFDFVPLSDSIIGCKYVFASEEYPEYVCSEFNDVFGFFITGPNPAGPAYSNTNLALIPGTNLPVAINTVNQGPNNLSFPAANCSSLDYSSLYVDNQALNGTYWCYDGYTVPFTISCNVVPGSMYHFKIAIADAGDHIFDSGVFLKGGSFLGNIPLPIAKFTSNIDYVNNLVTFSNQSQFADSYSWEFGDGTSTSSHPNPDHYYANDGIYNVKLISTNTCDSDTFTEVIYLWGAGISETTDDISFLTVITIEEGLFEINISIPENDNAFVQVSNIEGQQLISENIQNTKSYTQQIDLRQFSDGIYFLNVLCNNKIASYRLVK
jgi:PKD repeat protein